MTEVFQVLPFMAWTRGEMQRERAYSIAVTGNFQANSERIPRDFHKSSRVPSHASESLEKSSEIDPGEVPGPPKSTENRSRDTLGTPGGSQERSGGISGASWGVPGVPQVQPESRERRPGRPERAPGSSWERAEATRIDAKSRPEVDKRIFSREACARSGIVAMSCPFSSIFCFSTKSANP